jgi:hypothetical protein
VKANLVMRMDQSRWTSHGAYSGKLRCPEWLNTEEILSELGGAKGYRQYIKEIYGFELNQARCAQLNRSTESPKPEDNGNR